MTDGAASTPLVWRAGAMAVLGGGFACGYAATGGGRLGRLVTSAAVIVATGLALPLAAASRRPPIRPGGSARPDPGTPRITFSVVVAARDEAAVLPRIVTDIAAQDHRDEAGEPCFELLVVDDRSTDGSGAAAHAAADAAGIGAVTRIIRREGEGLADGNGAALTAAPP
ncbi:MAG: glycosyltransferase, partial [Candidatus Limnocylindrales bacterium]